jgi:hypothetical protein
MVSPAFDIPQSLMGSQASPKALYIFFLLRLCSNYFETMRTTSDDTDSIDAATAALVAFCPDKKTRETLWVTYSTTKASENTLTASVHTIGDLISYLSDTLEFLEKSTGGFA